MKTQNSYLIDCARRALRVFHLLNIPQSKYNPLVQDLFRDMESIYHGLTEKHIDTLRQFGFDLRKMTLSQRRDILFQLSLSRILQHNGYAHCA